MTRPADASTLNVQPRQRRRVYMCLAEAPDGGTVNNLLDVLDITESDLRETLRKLNAAGLARRHGGTWTAVPLTASEPRLPDTPETPVS